MLRRIILTAFCLSLLTFPPLRSLLAQAPTNTPTPTITPTITPTPELGYYLTVVPPGGELSDAQDGAVIYEVNIGDVLIAVPLVMLVSIKLLSFALRNRGHDA